MHLAVLMIAASAATADARADAPWVARILLAVNEETAAPQGKADTVPAAEDSKIEHAPLEKSPRGQGLFIKARVGDPSHLFAPLDANNLSMTIRAIYTFTPRLSLQAYTQGFLANGHYGGLMAAPRGGPPGQGTIVHISDLAAYSGGVSGNPDFQQGAVNVNAQFRWEYLLGSTLALVYARSQYPSVLLDNGENGVLSTRSIGRSPAVDQVYIRASFFWG